MASVNQVGGSGTNPMASMTAASGGASNVSAIQNKISDVQQRMEKLNQNLTMSEDEKAKKKKEYEEKLSELREQLSAAQQKQREKEEQAVKRANNSQQPTSAEKAGTVDGETQQLMTGLVKAQNSSNSIDAMNSVKTSLTVETRELKAQIKMDKGRGRNTDAKEETLSNISANLSVLDEKIGKKIGKTIDEAQEIGGEDLTPAEEAEKTREEEKAEKADDEKKADETADEVNGDSNDGGESGAVQTAGYGNERRDLRGSLVDEIA